MTDLEKTYATIQVFTQFVKETMEDSKSSMKDYVRCRTTMEIVERIMYHDHIMSRQEIEDWINNVLMKEPF